MTLVFTYTNRPANPLTQNVGNTAPVSRVTRFGTRSVMMDLSNKAKSGCKSCGAK